VFYRPWRWSSYISCRKAAEQVSGASRSGKYKYMKRLLHWHSANLRRVPPERICHAKLACVHFSTGNGISNTQIWPKCDIQRFSTFAASPLFARLSKTCFPFVFFSLRTDSASKTVQNLILSYKKKCICAFTGKQCKHKQEEMLQRCCIPR
jgi:hypothetical protein